MTAPDVPITPLVLGPGASHAVIFGGTFDPPHIGHTRIPALVRDERPGPGAWLVYVPAARSPFKKSNPVVSDADRLAMLRFATRSVPRSTVWTDEIDRAPRTDGPSYTIDTLRRARAALPPSTKLALLIGSDQAAEFDRWREPREILAIAEPLVMLRDPHRSPGDVMAPMRGSAFWTGAELQRWEQSIDPGHVIDVSATLLREQLAGHDMGAALMLDHEVLAYIESHALYGAPRNV